MKTITRERLKALLADLKGARPLSVTCLTDAKARKTDNPFGTILKAAKHQAFTGCSYAQAVERQRNREHVYTMEPFKPEPRKWGTRIAPCLVEHNGKHYLPVHITRPGRPLYLVAKDLSNQKRLIAVPKEVVKPYLPEDRGAPQQMVEKEVVYRDIALDSIYALTLDGVRYRVRA